MGRKKVESELTENKKKRDIAFNKKKSAIIKKVNQLSTLCDIQACVILYGPNGEPPCVWPEDSGKVNTILTRYLTAPVEVRQKRALSPSSLAQKPDKEGVMDNNNVNVYQLMELRNRLDAKIELVKRRIEEEEFNQYLITLLEDENKAAMTTMTPMQGVQNPQYENQFPLIDCYNNNLLFEDQKANVEMNTMNNGTMNNQSLEDQTVEKMTPMQGVQNPQYQNQFSLIDCYNNNLDISFGDETVEMMMNAMNGGGNCNGYYNNGGLLNPLAWNHPGVQFPLQAHQYYGQQAILD